MVEVAESASIAPCWVPRQLRVPRADRSVLAVPTLDEALSGAVLTRSRLDDSQRDLQGRSLSTLRRRARQECLQAARSYTSELCGHDLPDPPVDEEACSRPLFLAGHQPSLFHPGVWVKNFAIDHLARQAEGCSLNLLVDNDLLSTTAIRVPVGTKEAPRLESIPFDAARPVAPWEDAPIVDSQMFASFAERVGQAMQAWNIEPLLGEIWPDALAHCEVSSRLCDCLTAARHRQERRWGLTNLELPLSRLCRTDAFLWFASHLLAQLPRLRECHNQVLAEYRRFNRVRSRNHPVPELGRQDDWLEAPFWVWTRGEANRNRVFARQTGREVHLSDGREVFARLPLTPEGEACCAVEVLQELAARDVHLRTRALTTTLFARLCLGDLFVHGIGGAKYDEMTDQIILRFFGIEPPQFLAMSATLHLPVTTPWMATSDDESALVHRLRDIRFNADRYATDPQAQSWIDRKLALIAELRESRPVGLTAQERKARRPENRSRHLELGEIQQRLSAFVEPQRKAIEQDLADVRRQLAANQILQGREFSFALFPATLLKEFLSGAVQSPD